MENPILSPEEYFAGRFTHVYRYSGRKKGSVPKYDHKVSTSSHRLQRQLYENAQKRGCK